MRKLLLAGAASVTALALAPTDAAAQAFNRTTAPQAAGPVVQNEPGLQVRFAGRYRWFGTYTQSDFNNAGTAGPQTVAGATAGTATFVPNQPAGATAKLSSFDFYDLGRLWPGFDGMAANGLRYGAQLEIRFGASSGNPNRGDSRSQLFYRRMYGYLATPTLGQIRLGSGQVGAVELLYTGHMTGTIASGGWDGDLPTSIVGPANPAAFWYSASGGNNSTKISYLSPQFFGFDGAVSFQPNNGNFENQGCGSVTLAGGGAGCDRLSESNIDSQSQRIRNEYELMLRFRGSFGPVGVVVSGGYVGSDTVGASGNAQAYDGLSMGILGTQVSFAGVTLGGLITGGRGNYSNNARTDQRVPFSTISGTSTFANPAGPATTVTNASNATSAVGGGTPLNPLPNSGNNDDMFTWQVGAKYDIGPFAIGVAYHEAQYEGSIAAPANAKDRGLNIGGSYAVAPGLNLFVEYLYGTRQENGVNLTNGQVGTANNKGTTNVFGVGVAMNW
jgi:hypothetical protein